MIFVYHSLHISFNKTLSSGTLITVRAPTFRNLFDRSVRGQIKWRLSIVEKILKSELLIVSVSIDVTFFKLHVSALYQLSSKSFRESTVIQKMLYCLSRNFFYICYIWKELIPYLLKQVLQKQYGSIGKIVLFKINSN